MIFHILYILTAECLKKITYKVKSNAEPTSIVRSARRSAFENISNFKTITKFAFDTRRIDQETERNPRSNLQYWNRSQQFIDEEDNKRLDTFSKLIEPLNQIREKYGHHPEYFHSYARSLLDSVKRAIKVKEDDLDIFRPQLDYLEQLLFARYREKSIFLKYSNVVPYIETVSTAPSSPVNSVGICLDPLKVGPDLPADDPTAAPKVTVVFPVPLPRKSTP